MEKKIKIVNWKVFLPFLVLILIVFLSGCSGVWTIFNVKIEPETPCIDIKRTWTAPVIEIENNCSENFSFINYGSDEFDESEGMDKILDLHISHPYDCTFAVSPYYNKTCTFDEIIPVIVERVTDTKGTYGNIAVCAEDYKCNNILIPAKSSSTLFCFLANKGKWYMISEKVNISGEIKPP